MPLSLRAQLGQRMVIGFSGLTPDEDLLRAVRDYKIGNIILFRRNAESESQLADLCTELRRIVMAETGIAPFLTIDQEGGIVTRLPGDLVNVPGAMAVAATGNPGNARRMGLITAAQLRRVGIDFNLAPVMDVNCNPDNPVIGVRSYGGDPKVVAQYGSAMLKGLLDGGVYACLKHFPGHGDTAVDSHLGLPRVDRSLAELMDRELIPFCAGIAAGAPAVMTSHILFPQLETKSVPATLSRTIVTGLLRETLGFQGLILSDCMEMGAIQDHYGTEDSVVKAMAAGVDLVFVSQTPTLACRALKRAEAAVASGVLSAAQVEESAGRILAHKARLVALSPVGAVPDQAQCRAWAQAVQCESITCLTSGELPPLGEHPLFLGCREYRTARVSDSDRINTTFPNRMRALAGRGDALIISVDPGSEEIAAAVRQVQGHSCIVLATCNAHLLPGQLRLAEALSGTGLPMIAVALRDPYDLVHLPGHVAALCAWEYSDASINALWSRFLEGTLDKKVF